MPAILSRQAVSVEDFEAVRLIRNAGRDWMHDTREVSADEQLAFRSTFRYPVWLYIRDSQVDGFGLVKHLSDRYAYVTLAVRPEARGQGLGRYIYRDLRKRWTVDSEVWAVCRNDNTPSIIAALSAGYVVTTRIVAHDTIALKAETIYEPDRSV